LKGVPTPVSKHMAPALVRHDQALGIDVYGLPARLAIAVSLDNALPTRTDSRPRESLSRMADFQ